jgi:hypothetical protein
LVHFLLQSASPLIQENAGNANRGGLSQSQHRFLSQQLGIICRQPLFGGEQSTTGATQRLQDSLSRRVAAVTMDFHLLRLVYAHHYFFAGPGSLTAPTPKDDAARSHSVEVDVSRRMKQGRDVAKGGVTIHADCGDG